MLPAIMIVGMNDGVNFSTTRDAENDDDSGDDDNDDTDSGK